MAKRRKRTNKAIPAKGRLKEIADRLWSIAVRDDWNNKCAVCGYGKCEAHHLIPRQHQATRYELRNGITLCARHHQFDPDTAPHQNAAGWLLWLEQRYPSLHQWYMETVTNRSHTQFQGTTNPEYYMDVIRQLKGFVSESDYERIVGVKFSRWLEENE